MTQTSGEQHLVSPSILQKIDRLREKNVGKHIPLPQVRPPTVAPAPPPPGERG